NSNPCHVNWGKQTVFDFAGPLKFCDQRHGNRPDSGEDHADRNDSGKQEGLVDCRHIPTADHYPSEDEHKQEWLQEGLQRELNGITPRNMCVTTQHREKSFPVQSRKLLPVWCRKRFSRLGSEMFTSDSSAPVEAATLAISGISDPPRSA